MKNGKKMVAFTMLMAATLSTASNSTTAQIVTYTYDACGNRASRTIVLSGNKSAEFDEDDEEIAENPFADNDFLEDAVSEQRFRIYPNPTRGMLKIEFQVFSNDNDIRIEVYDLRGSVIRTIPQAQISNTVDLSGEPNGIYLLIITYDNERETWKIIKK